MKKNYLLLLSLLLPFVSSCKKEEVETLVIYNWCDYIFEGDDETAGTIDQFIEYYEQTYHKEINVEYYTFETNENMLNILKTGKQHYDLVCPSDYVIQKMIREDMVEKIDSSKVSNYTSYACPYIQNIFETNYVENDDGEKLYWKDYAIPYFWGTMGFMYNPEILENEEDINSWDILWNPDYKSMATLKDSVRDTYVAGIMYSYSNTKFCFEDGMYSLNDLKEMYSNKQISDTEYSKHIQILMNDTSDETLTLVKNALKEAKENAYGFEVDSGKADIVTGKIGINFCWSGDAVYALDCAEEDNDVYLNYRIPDEGSNVWFDGWLMPKGANVSLAQEFLNFISQPKIAALNMNEVGYSNSIAGEEIYDMTIEWYGSEEVYNFDDDGNLLDKNIDMNSVNQLLADGTIYAYDLNYFFGNTIEEDNAIIYIPAESLNRQISAQFPLYDDLIRCGVMEDFGNRNEAVLEMWVDVKSNDVPIWMYIFIIVSILVVLFFVINKMTSKKIRNKRIALKKQM